MTCIYTATVIIKPNQILVSVRYYAQFSNLFERNFSIIAGDINLYIKVELTV